MAHLSFLFTHWWDDSTFDWEYNTDYPKSFKVGSVIYRVYNMTEVFINLLKEYNMEFLITFLV